MKPDEQAVIERAAEWMATMDEGGSAEERAAFGRWLQESPRHVEEILALGALHRATENFDSEHELLLEAGMPTADVIPLREPPNAKPASTMIPPTQWRLAAVIALVIAVVAVLGWSLQSGFFSDSRQYSTAVGEQRTFDLPDGSIVSLNTHSQLQVRFTDAEREIHLESGEALFKVAPDSKRPFRVTAGRTVIQALGTQFNVYRRAAGRTSVAVLEGKVRIIPANEAADTSSSQVDLKAGEGAQIGSDGNVGRTPAVNSMEATAWRQRRLVFRKERLAEVVTEFNRYNKAFQLAVEEPEVADQRLSAVFDADDPQSLLQFLGDDNALTFERRGRITVIRSAEAKD